MDSDSSLKYSEIIKSSEESNPVVDLLERPTKKPKMVFRKSKVLARVLELLPRLQEEKIPESSDLNIENCAENEPYVELSPIGFTKEPENEPDPKIVILSESGIGVLSSEDEDEESSGDANEAKKTLIEEISEHTVTKDSGEDLPSIENKKMQIEVISKNNISEAMVH